MKPEEEQKDSKLDKTMSLAKEGATYFSGGTGVVSVILAILTIAGVIGAPIITIPIMFGVGALLGAYGVYRKWKQTKVKEKEVAEDVALHHSLDKRMTEITQVEKQIQEQLEKIVQHEQQVATTPRAVEPVVVIEEEPASQPSIQVDANLTAGAPNFTIRISGTPSFFDKSAHSVRNYPGVGSSSSVRLGRNS